MKLERSSWKESAPLFLHSVRFRLTLWFVLVLGVVLAGFSVFIYSTETRFLRSDAIGDLREESERIQGLFQNSNGELSGIPPENDPVGGALMAQGDLLMLVNTDGAILQLQGQQITDPESLLAGLWAAAGGQHSPVVVQQKVHLAGQANTAAGAEYLFLTTPVMREDQVLGYLVIGTNTDLASQQHRLAVSLGIGSLGMLALALVGGFWLADHAMRPVAEIARAARDITEKDLGRRLNIPGRDELADLAATFDSMISRLQSAFERQRRFVADASHELRTPVTIINLEAGRALEGQRPAEEYRRALQIVDAEGRRMSRLVNDLMALARMDSGQTILQFEALDLRDIAREAMDRISSLAMEYGVRLEQRDLVPAPVYGDRQYLLQLVSNLLENGVKHSGSGKTVWIDTTREGEWAILRVADNGPGIPEEHLGAIFDRFYRVDPSRSQNDNDLTSPSGSGLGLSIVAWIAHAHSGKVRVESKINEGTTFQVTLPLRGG